jgi:SH3-like domain-containing protein
VSINPNTMTLDEIRDWMAERKGWVKVKDSHGGDAWRHKTLMHDASSNWSHPFPPTIDAAAAAMPENYRVTATIYIGFANSCATAEHNGSTIRADGDTEILARYRLAMLCILVEESKP